FGIGSRVKIYYSGNVQIEENILTRGFISSVETGAFFGLGKETKIDSLEVIWYDGKINFLTDLEVNQVIEVDYSKAKTITRPALNEQTIFSSVPTKSLGLNYVHKENVYDDFKEQILMPHRLSQNGPFSAVADVNGDGLEDLFLGGALGQTGELYLQTKDGKFELSSSQPWEKHKLAEDMGCVFFDVDGDKDMDLFVASGGNEYKQGSLNLKDRLYINDGLGNFTNKSARIPPIYESSSCVKISDIDNDGDLDLFIGVRLISGKYAYPATSYFLVNNNGVFEVLELDKAPSLQDIGMVTDAHFTDIDSDGNEDLMIVGEWMNIKFLRNINGKFVDVSSDYGLDDTRGIWWSITASDLDDDGDEDFIVGNLGLNNKFKASQEHPFKVYANDFDKNGTNDIVLAKFYKKDYVPVRGRECTSEQMPYVLEKFEDYHSFASSNLMDILPEDKIEDAVVYAIKDFSSIVLYNNGDNFIRKKLPIQAQISPIKSSMASDFNNDGIKDILLAGNHYGVEVETTRYDAGFGALLLGNEFGDFEFLSPLKSGFYVPFDSRSMQKIKIGETQSIV
ncbi:MAG: FG-GAP-like repeat-containing protein, partial [Bacteroidota bacterium]